MYRLSSYTELLTNDCSTTILSLITAQHVTVDGCVEKRSITDSLYSDKALLEASLKAGILTKLDEESERRFVNDLNKASFEINNEKMFVALVPTLQCNLGCEYCYQAEMSYADDVYLKKMTESEIEDFISFLGLNKISSFVLYGGEPLLRSNYSLIKPVLDYIRSIGGNVLAVTNGTQIEAYSEYLSNDCISSVQITIDGMEKESDKLRKYKTGRGAWKEIYSGIKLCIDKMIDTNIRLNSTLENYDSCVDFIAFLRRQHDCSNVSFSISKVCGDKSDIEYNSSSCNTMTELRHPVVTRLETAKIFNQALYKNPAFCGTISKNGMSVIGPNAVWNCWNPVGDYSQSLGTVRDLLNNRDLVVRNDLPQFSEPCVSCKYLMLCQGECVAYYRENCGKNFLSSYLANSQKRWSNEERRYL